MFRIEKWNPSRTPGKASAGPPYGKPGMWSPFSNEYPTRASAEAALEFLIAPLNGEGARNPDLYRVHRQPVVKKAVRRRPATRTRQLVAA